MEVLDLFSAAAGGWSLGMHRAGFRTIAACEIVEWRRILYAENNPDVRIYADVRDVTADQLVRDLGRLPSVIVGSPPCQDISSANSKGRGVDGERSGLFFEAIRLVGECRPRWFALENSANLRTRGVDRVLGKLEALGYACWPIVVRASDVGANHERPRCWILGCDADRVALDPIGEFRGGKAPFDPGSFAGDADEFGRGARRTSGEGQGSEPVSLERAVGDGRGYRDGGVSAASDAAAIRLPGLAGNDARGRQAESEHPGSPAGCSAHAHADENGEHDGTFHGEMGECPGDDGPAVGSSAVWNGGLAHHIRLDDGLSARLAGTRVAVGRGRRSAAGLLVEAFGDAVVPQIPEAIGRAMLRVEAAMAVVRGA